MRLKKEAAPAILLAISMLVLVQAAVNVTVNTDIVAVEADNANITIVLPKHGEVNR